MRTALLSLVLLASCACGPRHPEVPVAQTRLLDVRYVEPDGSPGHGTCSVWRVAEHVGVTAGHCHPEGMLDYTYTVDGHPAEVTSVDHRRDVMVLDVDLPGPDLVLADREPELGGRVTISGWPTGTFLITTGIWSGHANYEGTDYTVASTGVAGGESGSPVLDDSGRVVGMLVAGSTRLDVLSLMVPLADLRHALSHVE